MERPLRTLSEADAGLESFHDCHVHGLRWRRDQFAFNVDLQYIVKWVAPNDGSSRYQFMIAEARLAFENADDVMISMEWSRAALDAQIDTIRVNDTRKTPNERQQRQFEIQFNEPDALIRLWSTGYRLQLLHEAVLSPVTSIPIK